MDHILLKHAMAQIYYFQQGGMYESLFRTILSQNQKYNTKRLFVYSSDDAAIKKQIVQAFKTLCWVARLDSTASEDVILFEIVHNIFKSTLFKDEFKKKMMFVYLEVIHFVTQKCICSKNVI